MSQSTANSSSRDTPRRKAPDKDLNISICRNGLGVWGTPFLVTPGASHTGPMDAIISPVFPKCS